MSVKAKIKVKLPKARNPFVQHLISKAGAGVHEKSKKAIRSQDKSKLKKEYLDKAA